MSLSLSYDCFIFCMSPQNEIRKTKIKAQSKNSSNPILKNNTLKTCFCNKKKKQFTHFMESEGIYHNLVLSIFVGNLSIR